MDDNIECLDIVMENGDILKTSILKKSISFSSKYASVSFSLEVQEKIYFCSGVIDDKYKTKVPFRIELKEKKTKYETDLCNYTHIFKNDMAIFQVQKCKFFLVNLNKTNFIRNKDGFIMPDNCIYVMDGFEVVDDHNIIIGKGKRYFLYDVLKNKKLTDDFDLMKGIDGVIYAQLRFETPTYNPVLASFIISKTGKVQDEVVLNDNVVLYLGKDELKNTKLIRKALMPTINANYRYFDEDVEEMQLCKM